jgi:hypothetical protein
MGRITWIAVALVLLTAAPAAQAGWLGAAEHAAEAANDAAKAAKAAKAAEITANGLKIDTKVGGVEAAGVSVEANGVKVEPLSGIGTSGDGGGRGGDNVWVFGLIVVGIGGFLFWRYRRKHA